MKHYKKPDGTIFAFELDGSQDALIEPDMTPVSAEDLVILRRPTALQLEKLAADQAKSALVSIDIASVRAIREWIISQPSTPAILKTHETAAQAERVKIKP